MLRTFGMIDFTSCYYTFKFEKEYVDLANKIYKDVANTFRDYISPFIFLDNQLFINSNFNSGDFLHPNLEGQKIIADILSIVSLIDLRSI